MAVALPSDILHTNVESTIVAREDLLNLGNKLATIEVKCTEICREFRNEQKELIFLKLRYTTRKAFQRDPVIYETIRNEFIDTLMRTTKKKGKGTYKRGSAKNQWTFFMREMYGVDSSVTSNLVLEEMSDEERYEIM